MLLKMNRIYLLLTVFSASCCVRAAEAKTTLESLATVENELQHIVDQLEASKIDGTAEFKEIADKINTLSADIQRLTKTDVDRSVIRSPCGCGITAAADTALDAESIVWKKGETPAEDCLDDYMASKTGCTYRGLRALESWSPRPAGAFNGSLFAWRGSVRARTAAVVRALWGFGEGYSDGYTFYIGKQEGNATITSINEWSPWRELERWRTPGILSPDRYVAFYLRIQAPGTITFGRECDSEPLFSHEVSIARGQEVRVQLQPYSDEGGCGKPPVLSAGRLTQVCITGGTRLQPYSDEGGKYLYCPPAV